ncbi:MAG: 50S ribosomal protein L18 [Pyrinomonadaceae bacterium]
MAQKDRAEVRRAVHKRIRRKVQGSAARPRLTIYRSLNHIYAQLIDDVQGRTITAASTTEKDLRGETGGNIDAAVRVGRAIAERALSNNIDHVVFDRGGYRYHGRVKALADAAREAGLNKEESNRAAEAEATPEGQQAAAQAGQEQ